ncbi:hypothetical protein MEO_05211 [Candida albicans P94015]|nr:hypothetical protein MEO_05211 [Candida albicans P94015]
MGKDTNKPVVTKLPLDKALLLINKKITTVPFYNKVHIIKSESQNDDNNSSNDRIPFDSLNTRTTLISNCANLYQIILNEYTNRFNSNNNTEDSQNNNGGTHIEAIPMENIPNGEYHGNKLTFNANNGIIELWINNNSFIKIPNLKNKYDNKKGGGKQGKEGQFIKLSKITSNLRHEEFIMKYKIDLKVNNSSSLTNQLIKSEFKYIIELLFDNVQCIIYNDQPLPPRTLKDDNSMDIDNHDSNTPTSENIFKIIKSPELQPMINLEQYDHHQQTEQGIGLDEFEKYELLTLFTNFNYNQNILKDQYYNDLPHFNSQNKHEEDDNTLYVCSKHSLLNVSSHLLTLETINDWQIISFHYRNKYHLLIYKNPSNNNDVYVYEVDRRNQ